MGGKAKSLCLCWSLSSVWWECSFLVTQDAGGRWRGRTPWSRAGLLEPCHFCLPPRLLTSPFFVFHDLWCSFLTKGFVGSFVSLLIDLCRTCAACNPEQRARFYINNWWFVSITLGPTRGKCVVLLVQLVCCRWWARTLWKDKSEMISESFQWDALKCVFPVSRCVIRTVRQEKDACNLGRFITVNLLTFFSSFIPQEILTSQVVWKRVGSGVANQHYPL